MNGEFVHGKVFEIKYKKSNVEFNFMREIF